MTKKPALRPLSTPNETSHNIWRSPPENKLRIEHVFLTHEILLAMQAEGAQILDTRDGDEFGAAHLLGSTNIGLGGQYGTWARIVLNHTHPIVIIADPGRESESAIRLGRIGFDHIAGYLENGLRSLESRPDLVAFTKRLSVQFAAELLSSSEAQLAIDVRAPRERANISDFAIFQRTERVLCQRGCERIVVRPCSGSFRCTC